MTYVNKYSAIIHLDKVASLGANTLNFTDLGSPYEGPPGTPHSGMDAPDAPHTPKYLDGGATTIPGKSAFVELQQHGYVIRFIILESLSFLFVVYVKISNRFFLRL